MSHIKQSQKFDEYALDTLCGVVSLTSYDSNDALNFNTWWINHRKFSFANWLAFTGSCRSPEQKNFCSYRLNFKVLHIWPCVTYYSWLFIYLHLKNISVHLNTNLHEINSKHIRYNIKRIMRFRNKTLELSKTINKNEWKHHLNEITS